MAQPALMLSSFLHDMARDMRFNLQLRLERHLALDALEGLLTTPLLMSNSPVTIRFPKQLELILLQYMHTLPVVVQIA